MSAFDIIVVGAGSAGCIIARRLVETTDARVLLLEAGQDDRHWTVRMPAGGRAHYTPRSTYNWHYETVPQPQLGGRRIYQPRGKGLGGSSSINALIYLRGHPMDYDRWATEGAAGWSHAEVLPYFRRLESFADGADEHRGGDGPVRVCRNESLIAIERAFLEAGRQAGFPATGDVNGRQQEGFCRFDMNIDRGVRASTAHAYLHGMPPSSQLTVRTGVHVRRVLVENGRATGVEIEHRGAAETLRAEREVILSAGAFGSPQLLMLSGVGPADHLREHGIRVALDLPGVGANLQDHPEIHIQHRSRLPVTLNGYLRFDRKVLAGLQWFLFKTGMCARNFSNTGAFLCSGPDVPHPDIQFHFAPCFFAGGREMRADEHGYLLDSGPMRPTSRGTLRLASADPREAPLIDPNYLATEADWQAMRDGIALARETLAQPAFTPFDAGEAIPGPGVKTKAEIDGFIREKTASAYHPVGTCRMGPAGDPGAVVDPQGRVHGIAGLRVADASIMPSLVSSNTNAPSMMIGEKLADAIAGRPAPAPVTASFVARVPAS